MERGELQSRTATTWAVRLPRPGGTATFTIEGSTRELGPGQLCVALADQVHTIRVGDEQMTMYRRSRLTSCRRIHNGVTTANARAAFYPPSVFDVEAAATPPLNELVGRCATSAESTAEVSVRCARAAARARLV